MKYKNIILILISVLLILILSSCNNQNDSKETTLFIATDLHYYSKELFDNGNLFNKLIENGDGKLVQYSSDITDALINEVINAHPNAFIISGDLTFNGEKISHKELSKKLYKIKKKGIPVLVIPGNHDIHSRNTYRFADEQAYKTANISPENFREIYYNLGFSDALYKDKSTLSYVYKVNENLWILMIDANQNSGYTSEKGSLSENTLTWIEECLIKAKEKGATVISVTHQNLLPHNIIFSKSFTIKDGSKLVDLLEKYEVKLNLSGHMHVQHIAKSNNENGIYDIANNSIAVNPNQYGVINISENKEINYKTHSIDMKTYAVNNNINDDNLKDFKKYSEQFFYNTNYLKIYDSLADFSLSETERKKMAIFASKVNKSYFSGTEHKTLEQDKNSEEYKLWRTKADGSFFYDYLYAVLKEKPMDHNTLNIK